MHKTTILHTAYVTHDVKRFILKKPKGFRFTPGQATEVAINKPRFTPGQATEVAINKPQWVNKKRPFTFTSLNDDLVLELTIKGYNPEIYRDHEGVTWKMHQLIPGDELFLDDPWGTIEYKGTGVFLAGGAGITPFIAIFRQLAKEGKLKGNKLIFSNKTAGDVILENELRAIFQPDDLVLTLTREELPGYEQGHIDESLIKKCVNDFSKPFYVCGPPPMLGALQKLLPTLGVQAEEIVFEK